MNLLYWYRSYKYNKTRASPWAAFDKIISVGEALSREDFLGRSIKKILLNMFVKMLAFQQEIKGSTACMSSCTIQLAFLF